MVAWGTTPQMAACHSAPRLGPAFGVRAGQEGGVFRVQAAPGGGPLQFRPVELLGEPVSQKGMK